MKTVKKIKPTPHEWRNLLMMMYRRGDNIKFEKFYEFTKTELCNFIRRVYYPGESCRDVVTEDIKATMQKVYLATAELKLIPRYGDTVDYLLYMFEISNNKRGVCTIDEEVEDNAPAKEGNPEYDLFARQAWAKLTNRQRCTLELKMKGYSSEVIGAVVGRHLNTVDQTIAATLERIRSIMQELLKDRDSTLEKKTKESIKTHRIDIGEFGPLQDEFYFELQLLKRLRYAELPEEWDDQLLAEIKDHVALIKRRLSE